MIPVVHLMDVLPQLALFGLAVTAMAIGTILIHRKKPKRIIAVKLDDLSDYLVVVLIPWVFFFLYDAAKLHSTQSKEYAIAVLTDLGVIVLIHVAGGILNRISRAWNPKETAVDE